MNVCDYPKSDTEDGEITPDSEKSWEEIYNRSFYKKKITKLIL